MRLSLEPLLWPTTIDYASKPLLINSPTHDYCHNIGRLLLQVLDLICMLVRMFFMRGFFGKEKISWFVSI